MNTIAEARQLAEARGWSYQTALNYLSEVGEITSKGCTERTRELYVARLAAIDKKYGVLPGVKAGNA